VIHHIIPWNKCKKHEYKNLIALCPNCHSRADRGLIDRKALRIYKANLRFAHDKFSQFEIDVLFALNSAGEDQRLPWLSYQNLFLKRLFDAGYVSIIEISGGLAITQLKNESGMSFPDIKTSPDYLLITPEGRRFIDSLAIDEL